MRTFLLLGALAIALISTNLYHQDPPLETANKPAGKKKSGSGGEDAAAPAYHRRV